MSLRKFLVFISIISFIFLFLTYFVIFNLLKIEIISIEKEKSIIKIKNLENYFQKELTNLYNLTKDWAAWDDAYFFMQNRNSKFVESNITKETFLTLKIDLLLFTDLAGKPVAGGLFDETSKKIYINNDLKNLVRSLIPFVLRKETEGIWKLVFFQNKPFMVVIHPVLKSNDTGPKNGYLLMGKFIKDKELKEVENLFSLVYLKILKTEKNFPQNLKFLKANLEGVLIEKYNFLNEKELKLRVFYPGEKYLFKNFLFKIIFAQIFLLMLFIIILFVIFNHYIIKALTNIIKEINLIKKGKKSFLSSKYDIEEIKELAQVINEYIHKIFLKDKISVTIAEKTENLIILFNKNGEILFKNRNISKYFTYKELRIFVKHLIKMIKENETIYKEVNIKNIWLKFQIIPFSKDLYLFVGWDITKIKAKEEELFKMATRDFLTGLYNRRYFEDLLERIFSASQRGEKFVLLFIDCDDLKKINDTFGHLIGDEVLKTVATAIKLSIRKEDIACRWGGDEFVVILNYCKKEEGLKIAERIIENLEKMPIKIDSKTVQINVSIGMVEIDGSKNINEILNLADTLAYSAKKEGKGKIKY